MALRVDRLRSRLVPGDFLAKTIAGVTAALEHAVFGEEHARLPGLLQRRDARAKVASFLLLLLVAGLTRHLVVLAVLYAVVLVTARLSRVPFDFFIRRVWLGVPLFAGVVALPALVALPGRPLIQLLEVGALRLAVTDTGLGSATLFVARVGVSVSLAVLLVLTTRWADLLKALRVLRVPEAFVVVLGMTYRYLFLFLQLTNNLFLARRSRTVAAVSSGDRRRWTVAAAGTLFDKSVKMSGEVHQAMIARGFAGGGLRVELAPLADLDWLLVAIALTLSSGLLLLTRGLS